MKRPGEAGEKCGALVQESLSGEVDQASYPARAAARRALSQPPCAAFECRMRCHRRVLPSSTSPHGSHRPRSQVGPSPPSNPVSSPVARSISASTPSPINAPPMHVGSKLPQSTAQRFKFTDDCRPLLDPTGGCGGMGATGGFVCDHEHGIKGPHSGAHLDASGDHFLRRCPQRLDNGARSGLRFTLMLQNVDNRLKSGHGASH